MKWLRLQLEAAGLSRFTPGQILLSTLFITGLISVWVQLSFGVIGLTVFALLAMPGAGLELLKLQAKQRSDQLQKIWPEIIDSLQSAASSGFGIIDSLEEIPRTGPVRVREVFRQLVDRIDRGLGMDSCLDWFKAQFGISQADRLAELIRIVHRSGGTGYLDALRNQSSRTRSEIALWGELESKQGWVSGTAKLAIVAPWIIVAILSFRPENTLIYNTVEGLTILGAGLVVSIIAYRIVSLAGSLTRPARVFAR